MSVSHSIIQSFNHHLQIWYIILFLPVMRNIFSYGLIFPLYLAGLSLILHAFIPHTHHYGNEPDHILNEFRKEGIYDKNDHSNTLYFAESHHSYICHFNPQVFPGKDKSTALSFIQTESYRIIPRLESAIINPFYGIKGYASVILSNNSSRGPPILFL